MMFRHTGPFESRIAHVKPPVIRVHGFDRVPVLLDPEGRVPSAARRCRHSRERGRAIGAEAARRMWDGGACERPSFEGRSSLLHRDDLLLAIAIHPGRAIGGSQQHALTPLLGRRVDTISDGSNKPEPFQETGVSPYHRSAARSAGTTLVASCRHGGTFIACSSRSGSFAGRQCAASCHDSVIAKPTRRRPCSGRSPRSCCRSRFAVFTPALALPAERDRYRARRALAPTRALGRGGCRALGAS